ncbi:putative phosphoribosylglycinamide formyltransferase [Kitasatospora setae KM-6054]|uniref:Phosphoribosylglycinamide formyltransferase n=1 Tax=Kitasatospora setae (strain ATCC 33774 / DSM 43861 / JCM 3304 / KCC A-0304 / NBRC 14216 / KM-6054) TaxID=452652 RepID=E4N6V2_KITSK|nr:phosphoribosylglycinamide formyltransferase [Kitasatospora sp. SID7827]BAJ26933.1 putative phosphoribosylglycinamide formyltransferase [Kitasatospora setae KM-6054]
MHKGGSAERLRVAVLVSHGGSNLRALHAASLLPGARFEVALVVSNNSGAAGLAFAREQGIAARHLSGRTHPDPAALDDALCAALAETGAGLLVTAGYLRRLGPRALREFAGRAVNVHPSLLPAYGGPGMYGEAVHRAVLAAGERRSGASVHRLTAEYDEGPVLARAEVPVEPDDTVESLAARVLAAEHELLPRVVAGFADGTW